MKQGFLIYILFITLGLVACQPNSTETPTTAKPAAEALVEQAKPMLEKCQFTLGFDAWEPYQYHDVGNQVAGMDIEIVQAVTDAMGCTLDFKLGTWVSLLKDVKAGDVDILLGASKTSAREEFAYFSLPYRAEEFSLFIRNNDAKIKAYESINEIILNQHKVGVIEDYYYGPQVAALLEAPNTSEYFVNAIMGELNMARLLDGDIDAYLEDSFVGASMLRRKGLSNLITEHGITINTGSAYVMFGKDSISEQQLEKFNAELSKLKASPQYQEIFDKYAY